MIRERRAILVAGFILVAVGCAKAPLASPRPVLRLTTGTPGGSFQPLGLALAAIYRLAPGGFDVRVNESAGSVSNVESIQRGTADLGFAFADVTYAASVGELDGNGAPFDRLRGMAVMGLTPLHLVVSGQSGVRSVPELRGRRVGVGRPGSGTALTARLVMKAFGLGPTDARIEALAYNDAADRLAKGSLDALFIEGSFPLDSVTRSMRAGARLLPLRGPVIEQLARDYPFMSAAVIPGGTYAGHPAAVQTIGVDNILVCSRDLDESVVYELVRRFHEALPALASGQRVLRFMDFEQAPATPIRLHEGAARYYRERELSQ